MAKEVEQQEKQAENHSENRAGTKTAVLWGVIVTLFLLQIAGGLSLWKQQQAAGKALERKIMAAMPEPVDMSSLETQFAHLQTKLEQRIATLATAQKTLAQELEKVKTNQQMTTADIEYHWAIKQIEYLLDIANQQLLLANDVNGALAAVELADARAKALADQRLHPLRRLLADEKLALRAVKVPDIEGIAVQLASLLRSVDKLQLIHAPPVADEHKTEDIAAAQGWKSMLVEMWQQVKSLVVIRHQQTGTVAVWLPQQRDLVYQNMRLKLEAARVALLLGQEAVYKDSLQSAQADLSDYFTGDTRDAMMAVLAELVQHRLQLDLPDISASLTWIRDFQQ